MEVRFWGTRGSIAVPGSQVLKYGGNTPCVEVVCGPHRVILDAGTGLRHLGDSLVHQPDPTSVDLLLSHFHLDHIIGLGFFAPMFRARSRIRIHGGLPTPALRAALRLSLSAPLMPDILGIATAGIGFTGFQPGDTLSLHPGLTVRTASLRHPGGATGYRIAWNGGSVAYVTDTEHTPGVPDPAVAALVNGADLLIYDSTYTDAELPKHTGWGHSTWQEALRIADAAGVGRVVLFHHDPKRTDADLDAIAAAAASMRPGTFVAAEGLALTI